MYVVEIEYTWDAYDERNERREFDSVEMAAQIYESEAEPSENPAPLQPSCSSHPLSEIVEELATGLRLESLCTETGKRVVAYELVEAVV